MNQQSMMQNPRPAVSKWLWIILIIVAVLGAAFFAWFYLMGPGKKVATTTTTATDKTAGWKTYTNATDGFSMKYPADWTSAKDLKYFKSAVIGYADPATTKKITAIQTANPTVTPTIFSDVVVAYYAAITDMTGSPATLEAALKDTIHYKSYTATTLDGKPAFDAIVVSNPNYYAVFALNNLHVYEIEFPNTLDKTKLTDIEMTILANFKFITQTPASESADITCTDNTYSFTYVRPASWGACKVKEAKLTGITDTFYVEIATKDANFAAGDQVQDPTYYSPFAISVYTPAEWQALQAGQGAEKDTLITHNDNYYFGWSQANGVAATDFGTKTQDIAGIINSFKLK